jgi:hypothetical protein
MPNEALCGFGRPLTHPPIVFVGPMGPVCPAVLNSLENQAFLTRTLGPMVSSGWVPWVPPAPAA